MTTYHDPSREIVAVRVQWETESPATGAAAKRALRRIPTHVRLRLTREQEQALLTVKTKHERLFDTLDEALAFSAEGPNRFVQVKYAGNRNFSFVGRDGYLFQK